MPKAAGTVGSSGVTNADSNVSTIVVLDELNTPLHDASTARAALNSYLAAQPARLKQRTMLVAIDDQGYEGLVPDTTDSLALRAGLSAHKAMRCATT